MKRGFSGLNGFPLKTKLLLIGIRVRENIKDGFRKMKYEMNKPERDRQAEHRKWRAETFADSFHGHIYGKGDSYSDWYSQVMAIKQRRVHVYNKRMKNAEVIS